MSAWQGQWPGNWSGSWYGQATGRVYVDASLNVTGTGFASFTVELTPGIPVNGPSGGARWTHGYRAPFDYRPRQRRGKRDEILFIGQGGKA